MTGWAVDELATRPMKIPIAVNGRLPSQHAGITVVQVVAGKLGRAAAAATAASASVATSARLTPVRISPAVYAQEGSGMSRSCWVQPLARSAARRPPPTLKAAAIAAHPHMETMKKTGQV